MACGPGLAGALRDFLASRERRAREATEWETWQKHLDEINRDAAALVADQARP